MTQWIDSHMCWSDWFTIIQLTLGHRALQYKNRSKPVSRTSEYHWPLNLINAWCVSVTELLKFIKETLNDSRCAGAFSYQLTWNALCWAIGFSNNVQCTYTPIHRIVLSLFMPFCVLLKLITFFSNSTAAQFYHPQYMVLSYASRQQQHIWNLVIILHIYVCVCKVTCATVALPYCLDLWLLVFSVSDLQAAI